MTQGLKVSETTARTIRTAPQGGLAWALTEGVDAFIYNFDDRQYGIAVVLLTMLVVFIQNAIENGIGKAFLRDMPPTDVPIIDAADDSIEEVNGRHEL